MINDTSRAIADSMKKYLLASEIFRLSRRSILLDLTSAECKYRLWGMITAPIIPEMRKGSARSPNTKLFIAKRRFSDASTLTLYQSCFALSKQENVNDHSTRHFPASTHQQLVSVDRNHSSHTKGRTVLLRLRLEVGQS